MKSGFFKEKRFYRSWIPEQYRKVIIISHGLGEHSGRYSHLAKYFNQEAYAVFALDHIGHGKTEGIRGHVDRFEDYTDNLRDFIDFVEKETNTQTFILIGHSLGAVIAHYYMILGDERIQYLILSSPGYEKRIPPNAIKAGLGKLLSAFLPKLTLWNELDAKDVSRDPEVVQNYIDDELNHDRVSTRFFTSFLEANKRIQDNPDLTLPVLYLVAGNDQIVSPTKSREIYDRMSGEDKKFIEYPELYHEIFNEKEQEKVFQDILNYLDS